MPRKRNDVAGVFEKYPGSGIWYIRFRANGKNVRRKIGERIEAERQLAAILLAKRSDQTIILKPSRGVTVGELCDQYLAHIQDESNPDRPSDQTSPPQRLNAIKKAFGARSASSIQPAEIRKWLMGLGHEAATLNRYRSVFSSVYRYAKEEGILTVNPVRDVKQFKVELPHPRWLQPDEEVAIRGVLNKWIAECPPEHKIKKLYLRCHPIELIFALGTGIRKDNQYKIRWDEHIDFLNRAIHLPPWMTKTGKALDIPMIDDVYNTLREMEEIQRELADVLPLEEKTKRKRMVCDGRVFIIAENREWWRKALKEAGVKKLRWHDLRHTFASRLVAAGVHLSIVQKACGHSSHNTTTRYAHVNDTQVRNALSNLNSDARTASA
jgi:integrase